jgi:hypothetical protein
LPASANATLVASTPAFAQRRGGGSFPFHRSNVVFIGGYFYDPFFGPYPWWPLEAYPYGRRSGNWTIIATLIAW